MLPTTFTGPRKRCSTLSMPTGSAGSKRSRRSIAGLTSRLAPEIVRRVRTEAMGFRVPILVEGGFYDRPLRSARDTWLDGD